MWQNGQFQQFNLLQIADLEQVELLELTVLPHA
jgi:hypothetical protein